MKSSFAIRIARIKIRFLLCFALLWFSSSNVLGCIEVLKTMIQLAEENKTQIHCPGGFCLFHSAALAHLFVDKFGPAINQTDLHILVIRHKDLASVKDSQLDSDVQKRLAGIYTHNGISKLWNYHAVVEYQGYVIDFAYADFKKIVSFQEYIHTMFPMVKGSQLRLPVSKVPEDSIFNQPANLVVTSIPIAEYLARFSKKKPSLKSSDAFIDEYTFHGLEAFVQTLNKNPKEAN